MIGVLEIVDRFPVKIRWVIWRDLIGVLEAFDGCPGYIRSV